MSRVSNSVGYGFAFCIDFLTVSSWGQCCWLGDHVLRTNAWKKFLILTTLFKISLNYQALEKNWTSPWADSLDSVQHSCSIFPVSRFIMPTMDFYKLEDNECIRSMEQWDQCELLVFVFRNINSMDNLLYHVDFLTCTEGDFKVCSVLISSVHTVLMRCFHADSIITLAPGSRNVWVVAPLPVVLYPSSVTRISAHQDGIILLDVPSSFT